MSHYEQKREAETLVRDVAGEARDTGSTGMTPCDVGVSLEVGASL